MKKPATNKREPAQPAALTLAQKDGSVTVQMHLPSLPAIDDVWAVNWSSVTLVDGDDVVLTFGQSHPDLPRITTCIAVQMPSSGIAAALADEAFAKTVLDNIGHRPINTPDTSVKDALHPNAKIYFERAQFLTVDVFGIETAIRFFRLRPVEARLALARAGARAANGIDASLAGLYPVAQLAMSSFDFAKFWRRFARAVPNVKDPFSE